MEINPPPWVMENLLTERNYCRHKALKDLKDEIFDRFMNLKELASG